MISNLALLASEDNSALSNSVFEVKRRNILERDRDGSYIPACTRNVFLKYYTEAEGQQIHFWGEHDREGYLEAMQSTRRAIPAQRRSPLMPSHAHVLRRAILAGRATDARRDEHRDPANPARLRPRAHGRAA